MTDDEKLAAIRAVLEDLQELHRHFIDEGQFQSFPPADSGALKRIAEIIGKLDYH